jgi:hypothetical protein
MMVSFATGAVLFALITIPPVYPFALANWILPVVLLLNRFMEAVGAKD